ncbi:MAG: hypothetical protein HUU21_23960 [Polyangiaceae bacterium]|nr:hypothetical protein [Polyangiaceae bacterium]
MAVWKGVVGVAAAGLLCACQIVSGLDDLEAAGGGETTSTSSTSGTGGGGGFGGGGGLGGGGGENPCAKGECENVFLADTKVPVDSIAVDYEYIYWAHRGTDPGTGSIWRARLDGTSGADEIAKDLGPTGIVASPLTKMLYITDASAGVSTLKAAQLDNPGSFTNLFMAPAGEEYRALSRSALGDVFWVEVSAQNIRKINFEPPLFMTAGAPRVIASDADEIFWFDGASISRGLITGGGRAAMAQSDPINTFGIAVDTTYIYWTVKVAAGAVFVKMIDGADQPMPIIPAQSYPSHILADGKSIYWVTEGADSCNKSVGSVMKAPAGLAGGPLETLAAVPCPSNLVSDDFYVYWGSGTTIFRVKQ